MHIEISGIVCRYGKTPAVSDVNLEIRGGEFLALLGPSGSGKTTLLRILAGLEAAESGSVLLNGQNALGIPPNKRGVGFVFQHYALFRHMTIAHNIAFGLAIRARRHRPPAAEIARRVEELLELVQLPGLGKRYPQQLSGGQRQRVALARALAIEPQLLLLDEPFGALDAKVRTELRVWLKSLHRRLGITSVFVTHDQDEAMELADRVVVMRAGKIEQVGTPAEVYAAPASAFVYGFLGTANRIDCQIAQGVARGPNGAVLADGIDLPDGPAGAWFRPHQVDLSPSAAGNGLAGTILDVVAIGPRARITFAHGADTLTAELPAEALAPLDLRVDGPLRWAPRDVRIFPN